MMGRSVNNCCLKQFHHDTLIYNVQKCFIVDTLPRHLLPLPPKIKAQEIAAKAILDPMYRDSGDPNPYLHFNKLNHTEQYELPLAVRWSNILKISKEKIAKLFEDYPELTDIDNSDIHIERISVFLSDTFGGESYMRTMIMRAPLILNADILYLQHQINDIVSHLSDHVIDDRNSDGNKPERIEFVLDMIRRQSSILTQNIDGDVIPRILFLKQLLNPYELTQLLLNLSSVIIMPFHRLIRIVFIQQKSINKEKDKENLMEISKVDLNDMNVVKRNLELIKDCINNDGIMLHEILRLAPTIMAKVFNDYNYWLHDQIEDNYYYHPLFAERDISLINDSSFYSEPILNLIDGSDHHCALIEGKVLQFEDKKNIGLSKKQKKQNRYQKREEIQKLRKHKTIRQLEVLVGDVYKAHTFKQSIF